jgi:LuxR family transcriptional regulator, maltose regulon positive regulatory protein
LIERLSEGIDRPLILICAPAGFGKTTLVTTWLEQISNGYGEKENSILSTWLSLDESDSDLRVFMLYFIAAIRNIFNEACTKTLTLLQSRDNLAQADVYTTFSNDLEVFPGDFILVLDDYQEIHGMEVHNLLSELLHHWPKPLHLVLISRTSPLIPVARLRARGEICEIRSQDLRFTSEETASYLSQAHLAPLSQSALLILDERFEGWIAGLHLAALSLCSLGSQDSILSALSGNDASIAEYLIDEVLSRQVPAIQTFLLITSILDRFNAALCEAVIGETDRAWNVRACLDWIERSELFITSLDNRHE